jgi:hypothetical protein
MSDPTHNPAPKTAHPTSRRWDGDPETPADRRFFDLRESGYTGPIDQDGYAVDSDIPACFSTGRGTDVVSDSGTSDVLRAASRYLRCYGWIQGGYYDQTATVFTPAACTVGAIGMVCYGGPVDAPALNYEAPQFDDFDRAVNFLDRELRNAFWEDVYSWNDLAGRTKAEVIAMLNAAADDWDRIQGGAR